jgi:uracil-DNA glycosylase
MADLPGSPIDEQEHFRQYVYSNCINKQGPCGDCANDGVRSPRESNHPSLGAGTTNTDVVVVNRAPGGSGDNVTQIDRALTDPYENPHELPACIQSNYSGGNWDSHTEAIINEGWGGMGTFEKYLIEGRYPHYDGDNIVTVPFRLNDIYYTNALKCPKFDNNLDLEPPADDRNKNALEYCLSYLEFELKTLVEPDLVIAMGKSAIAATFAIYDVDIGREHANVAVSRRETTYGVPSTLIDLYETTNTEDGSHPEFVYPAFGDAPVIIPSYHFSMLNSNYYRPWFTSTPHNQHEYCLPMVKRIRAVLT